MQIKLCGLTRIEDIETANLLQPDYVGFVFYQKSKRNISVDKAVELRKALNKEIKVVAVFLNEEIDKVVEIANYDFVDMVQVHGNLSKEYIKDIKTRTNKKVIQAFRIKNEEDIKKANASIADLVLLDNGDGGTGKPFNWELLRGMKRDFILAGGLNAENVGLAIEKCHPIMVDASSSIETNGVKDKEKMAAFVAAVRR